MINKFFKRVVRFGAVLGLGLAMTMPALAAFPEKPIRLVVPFPPGGGVDSIARALGTAMSQRLGQSIVIDNKPGAGTIIGTDAVARSPADGYTLVLASFAHAVNPSLVAKLPYSTDTGFAPIILIGRGPNVLVVRADSPYKTVADVLVAAQSKPGALTYASQGNGTSAHLAGEMFVNLAKVEMTHIPYKGVSGAITDIIGGRVDIMFATSSAVSSLLSNGKLRALAVTTPQRSPAFKGMPAVAETVPGYSVESWYGLYAPAGTPANVIAKLNESAKAASQTEAFRRNLQQEGVVVSAGSPEELNAYVRGEEARWRKVVETNKIKID
ncbi:tripartite tricarboxylate transporter substrate binding protein [Ottowia thiooxydans]|uniref:tripartite tricarboxylate transporter substrate binding protein n=1 Tax=Ottowia thiooxydans TaxID=219182 RepID=UPI00048B5DC5